MEKGHSIECYNLKKVYNSKENKFLDDKEKYLLHYVRML